MDATWLKCAAFCVLAILSGCQTAQRRGAAAHFAPASASADDLREDSSSVQPVEFAVAESNPDDSHRASLELPPEPVPEDDLPIAASLSLADLEQLALRYNPAIQQAAASASKAQGIRDQVGRYPNPTVGYQGSQLLDQGTDQHTAFIEQDIVLGGKLRLNEHVLNQHLNAQLWSVEVQRYRVLTDVRQKFYEALAAQRRRDLAADFQQVANKGVEIARIRREALEGALPDVLQAEIQFNEVDLLRRQADLAYRAAWEELVAVVGLPGLELRPLSGSLPTEDASKDWEALYQQLLVLSPELNAACARVATARANLERQQSQPIPNLGVAVAAGYDNGTGSEMMNVQVGLPVPIFNRNEGNISAAQAEYCRASQELRRLQMSLKARLARVAQQYDSAALSVRRYEEVILPKAQEMLSLSEAAYAAGEYDYLHVLLARRTFFDSNLGYIDALMRMAQADSLVQGMLLTGGLDETPDLTVEDGLRGQALSGQ